MTHLSEKLQADPFASFDIPQAEAPKGCRHHGEKCPRHRRRHGWRPAAPTSYRCRLFASAGSHDSQPLVSVTLISAASHQAAAFGVEEVILFHSHAQCSFFGPRTKGNKDCMLLNEGLHATERRYTYSASQSDMGRH